MNSINALFQFLLDHKIKRPHQMSYMKDVYNKQFLSPRSCVGGRGLRTLDDEVDLRSLGLLLGLYRAGVGAFIVDVHLEEERGRLSSGTPCTGGQTPRVPDCHVRLADCHESHSISRFTIFNENISL